MPAHGEQKPQAARVTLSQGAQVPESPLGLEELQHWQQQAGVRMEAGIAGHPVVLGQMACEGLLQPLGSETPHSPLTFHF